VLPEIAGIEGTPGFGGSPGAPLGGSPGAGGFAAEGGAKRIVSFFKLGATGGAIGAGGLGSPTGGAGGRGTTPGGAKGGLGIPGRPGAPGGFGGPPAGGTPGGRGGIGGGGTPSDIVQ